MDPDTTDNSPLAPGTASAATGPKASEHAMGSSFASTFASLHYRSFAYLWLGQVTHSGALWVDMVARPLLVLAVTGSAVHLGLVMAVRTIPAVALGLLAGVLADNLNRRTMLLATKATVFTLSAIFALLLILGWVELWHIYLFTALRGATMAFDQPARRAMVPSLVPRHLVTNAMALSAGSLQVMRILGAGGAGLLVAFGGIEAAFVAVAVLYGAAVALTWMLRVPDHERRGYRGVRAMGSDLSEGFRYAWNNPTVRGIIIAAAGYYTFGMSFVYVFIPLIAMQVLDIGDSGFGYMMAAIGIGGVVGTLLLAGLNPRSKRGLLTIGMLANLGVMLVLFSAVTYIDSVALAFVTIAILGLGQSWLFPVINATLLEATEERMRGRVFGLLSLDRALTTLGGALAGFLAAAVGAQIAMSVFGFCCILTAVAMFALYPAVRRID